MPIRIEIDFDPSKGETLADYVAALQVFGEIGEAPWAPPRARSGDRAGFGDLRAAWGGEPGEAPRAAPRAEPSDAEKLVAEERRKQAAGEPLADGPGHDRYKSGAIAETKTENGAVVSVTVVSSGSADTAGAAPAQRVPGHPSLGRKKRTSAEVAEDEAYFAEHGKAAAAPEPPPVAAETQAQDAADEAGTGEQKAGGPTLDDLRKAIGKYAVRFGLPAAVKDVPALLGSPVAQVPLEGIAAAIEKVMAAVEGPSPLAAAHAEIETKDGAVRSVVVTSGSPGVTTVTHGYEKAPEADVNGAARVWTKDDFMAAVKAYAAKFDGPAVELKATEFARFDVPKFIADAFAWKPADRSMSVMKMSDVPDTSAGWEKATSAVLAAIEANPFKRAIAS